MHLHHFRRWFDNMNPLVQEESIAYHNESDLCTTCANISDYSSLETLFRWLAGQLIGITWLSWVKPPFPFPKSREIKLIIEI